MSRRLAALAAGVSASLIVALGLSSPSQAATSLPGAFGGNAYGSFANAQAGPVAATLGYTALVGCSCKGTNGQTLTNTANSLAAGQNGKVMRASGIIDTTLTQRTATSATVTDTSTVSGLNMFGGLITASSVKAVATTAATAGSIKNSTSGSTFTGLTIAGHAVSSDVGPNAQLTLPGVGTVTLKKVSQGAGSTTGALTVEMITVNVTQQNSFGLPVGSQIIVAHAASRFSRNVPNANVQGVAYGTFANAAIGNSLQDRIGATAIVAIPDCVGTSGKTLTNTGASLTVGNDLSLGSAQSTAFGGTTASGTVARTTSTVNSVGLLNGLIKAGSVTAVAQETFKNGQFTGSAAGSGFTGLSVAGVPVPSITTANTKLTLPGFGYVIVNEESVPAPNGSGGTTAVNGLHVFVTQSNALGLPAGSQIIIAHAQATATRP